MHNGGKNWMKFEILVILFLLSGFVSGLAVEENVNPEKSFWEKVFSWSYWIEKIGFTGKVVEEVVSEEVVSEEVVSEEVVVVEDVPVEEAPVEDVVVVSELKVSDDNLTEDISETIQNVSILENVTIEENVTEVLNESLVENVTEILNESLVENVSLEFGEFVRAKIIVGKPVRWVLKVNVSEFENGTASVSLPLKSENISVLIGDEINEAMDEIVRYDEIVRDAGPEEIVRGLTGEVALDVSKREGIVTKFWRWLTGFRITGRVVKEEAFKEKVKKLDNSKEVDLSEFVVDNGTEVAIEYYTPGPTKTEVGTASGKRVVISADDEFLYSDVLAYSELDDVVSVDDINRIRVYWVENGSYIDSNVSDLDEDGFVDYVEWNVLHLSSQTFEIIYITKAEHLDSNRSFVADIYDEVRYLDGNWSEEILDGEFVRVTFEIALDNTKDITIYPRVVNGTPEIEVYEKNGSIVVARFVNLSEGENKVFLTELNGSFDVFDLKIVGGSVEFDYIVDPSVKISLVESYYFSLGVGVTSGYLPFKNGQTGVNAVPFATQTLTISDTLDNWQKILPDIYFNSSGVIVQRNLGTTSAVNVMVYVVEFYPTSLKVQNGTFSFTSGSSVVSIPENVNLSSSALVFYYQSTDVTDDYNDNMIRGMITSDNQVTFNIDSSGATGVKSGHWYVFESVDNSFSVQTANLSFGATATTATSNINSVFTNKTFLISSYITSENSDDSRDGSFSVELINSTTIRGTRLGIPAATFILEV